MPFQPSPGHCASVLLHLALAAVLCLSQAPARAGAFTVSPMRLDLGGAVRSAALTVRNEDTVPMSFQVRAMAWTQDDAGQDAYDESPELVHFPRLLLLAPGQEGVIRVGLRQPLTPVEKAYRLFVEELPPPAGPEAAGSTPQVRMLVRFGAPVFVQPPQPRGQLEAHDLSVAQGHVRWRLHNAGNRHERLEAVRVRAFDAQEVEVFDDAPGLGYLLAGRARRFEVPLPHAACRRIARVLLQVRTASTEILRTLPVAGHACP